MIFTYCFNEYAKNITKLVFLWVDEEWARLWRKAGSGSLCSPGSRGLRLRMRWTNPIIGLAPYLSSIWILLLWFSIYQNRKFQLCSCHITTQQWYLQSTLLWQETSEKMLPKLWIVENASCCIFKSHRDCKATDLFFLPRLPYIPKISNYFSLRRW